MDQWGMMMYRLHFRYRGITIATTAANAVCFCRRSSDFGDQRVALTKFALQVLGGAEALELAIYHYGYPSAKRFTFFHTIRNDKFYEIIRRETSIYRRYLCDVRTIACPLSLTWAIVSHNCRRATGSIPVVGSSKKTIGGSPTSATAVLNLRLLPPLHFQIMYH